VEDVVLLNKNTGAADSQLHWLNNDLNTKFFEGDL
jgi:hypothetical protein